MDNRLLLVHSITLLYRESQLQGVNENSATLVKNVLSNIKVSEMNLGIGVERDIIESLKTTALAMCETPVGHRHELGELLQRLQVNTLGEEGLYNAIYEGIANDLPDNVLKRTCLSLKRSLNEYFKEEKIKDIMNKAQQTIKFNRSKITDFHKFVADVGAQLEQYQTSSDDRDPAIISEVSLGELDQITNVFNNVTEQASGTALLRTGWQCLNRMLDGGFRRGESVVIGALQHKWKTGMTLSLFDHFALYNTPVLTDITKKPLLLRISFEDPLELNFEFMYAALKQNETGVKVIPGEATNEEMALYVKTRLEANGYHIKLINVNPSGWTYKSIQDYIIKLEAEGYEVHCCMVDYLIKIPTTGCDPGPMGHDICNMYERLTNWMKARKILFITPHQLNPEAKKLIREGRGDFVRELVGKGYYRGSSQIDQVVDLEIYIHIEILNGVSYLTLQRGKHRKNGQTPIEYQYCVLAFSELGILDDVNGPDTTRSKVGGGIKGSADEQPFWDYGA